MANRRHHFTTAAGSLLLLVALGCSRDGERDREIREIIASGLRADYHVARVPEGQIDVMSGWLVPAGTAEESDFNARHVTRGYLASLRTWEERGYLSLLEHQQSARETIGRMGTRTFTIIPDERLRAIADHTLATDGYLMIPLGSVTIEQIISNTSYQSPALSGSEQFRLVLGTYRLVATDIAKEILPSTDDRSYRFKALLKLDPFTNTFKYLAADYGNIGETEWVTQRVQ